MKWLLLLAGLCLSQVGLASQDCNAPWGGTVRDGQSVRAYRESRAVNGNRCQSEYRRCSNGFLSGSYRYDSCYEDYDCYTSDFGHLMHNERVTAYLHSVEYGVPCVSEIRQCSYGRLSGSYHYRSCVEQP